MQLIFTYRQNTWFSGGIKIHIKAVTLSQELHLIKVIFTPTVMDLCHPAERVSAFKWTRGAEGPQHLCPWYYGGGRLSRTAAEQLKLLYLGSTRIHWVWPSFAEGWGLCSHILINRGTVGTSLNKSFVSSVKWEKLYALYARPKRGRKDLSFCSSLYLT